MTDSTAPARRILAIDGGGLRGLIPACLLAGLERATGRPARESFDFLAGTSTGAVLAAGLAAGVPAGELVRLYVEDAPRLFDGAWWRVIPRVLTGSMYDIRRLNALIGERLPAEARGWRIDDVPNDILITAKGLRDGHQWYFVKDCPRNACTTGALPFTDCVTASAAAPTYFAPWRVAGIGELVDGGVGVAGNPVYQACVEAFEFTDRYDPRSTVIVSLGTGRFFERPRPRWLGDWLGWVLTELFRSPGEQQTELTERHYGAAAFYRIDVELEREIPIDSVRHIPELREIGEWLASNVEWGSILDGTGTDFAITPARTTPREYTVTPAP
ncbi:MAG TPA: patatin-like phospholipase family protein [Candidatus Limnocylindria bacterium]|nr:patatin-like phospholipase family protein [Candidatus Limnocylindria bacterium]